MKRLKDKINPEKLILGGLKTLSSINLNFYSRLKSDSKRRTDITFIGEKKIQNVKSQLFEYSEHDCIVTEQINSFEKLKDENGKVFWLNFHGIHDVNLFQRLASEIKLDRLTLRQLVDTTQRPKVEEFDTYIFFNVKSILKDKILGLKVEQLSFVLSDHYILSFQEEEGDHFDSLRSKLLENMGVVRKRGCDYLLAQLLDAILDNYFETIDSINQEIAMLEKSTISNPSQDTLLSIEKVKKSTEIIKKSLLPFKEALVRILNDKTSYIKKGNKKYYRDLKNSCLNAIEEIDASNKSLESLTNIYFSSLSHKMNEIMRVLTTVATIFIPLTFIAGIYGMNFDYMPELKYKNGYFIIWGIMLSILVGMLVYFKRRKWL
ncbi:MAG: magnesium/cobalt transporter CorA [Flammeovirgaceae bacterium]|nr:magnesium/cobalt transporter CorA [Flammeovirgaceae bacterium]